MDTAERKRAEFYARLASIESVHELREGERLLWEDDLRKLIVPWPEDPPPVGTGVRVATQLRAVQECARDWIYGLLKGREVRPAADNLGNPVWKLKRGKLLKRVEPSNPQYVWTAHMAAFMTKGERFPFGLCRVCGKVFARVRRQKYCSPNCAYKATEAGRKKERTEYMKKYMRQWRKRAK